MRTNNKLNPHVTLGPGIEPGPQRWKVSALTSAPSLLPLIFSTFPQKALLFFLLYGYMCGTLRSLSS